MKSGISPYTVLGLCNFAIQGKEVSRDMFVVLLKKSIKTLNVGCIILDEAPDYLKILQQNELTFKTRANLNSNTDVFIWFLESTRDI